MRFGRTIGGGFTLPSIIQPGRFQAQRSAVLTAPVSPVWTCLSHPVPKGNATVPYGPVQDALKYRPAALRNSSADGAAIQACTICRAGMGVELCCISCRSGSAIESP